MKIRDRYTRGVLGTPPVRSQDKAEETSESGEASRTSGPPDRVHISGKGVEIRRARSLALRAPDIRQEMVDEIVGQIANGQYQVTGADVAPRMIREHLALTWR